MTPTPEDYAASIPLGSFCRNEERHFPSHCPDDPAEVAAQDKHATECPDCARLLAQIAAVITHAVQRERRAWLAKSIKARGQRPRKSLDGRVARG